MKRRDIIVAGMIAVIAGGLVSLPPLDWLRGLSIDVLFVLRHALFEPRHDPSRSPSVVVAIDEETYRRPPFDDLPKVMWTRQIASVMNAVLDGGASVVGFDLILPTSVERYVRGFDREFLVALNRASRDGRVVLAKVQHQLKPISPFRGYSFAVGHQKNIRPANVFEDPDGIIRRVPLLFRSLGPGGAERTDPSIALELAARRLGVRPEIGEDGRVRLAGRAVPVSGDASMLINFASGARAIPTYSLADLFACAEAKRSDFFRARFAGKVVFIGAVLDVEDRKITSKRLVTGPDGERWGERCVLPVMDGLYRAGLARDSIPGVYVHATAVNNLILGDALRDPGRLAGVPIAMAIAAAAAAATMLLSPLFAGATIVAGAVVWTVAAAAAFRYGLVLPLFDALAAAVAAFGVLLGYRFAIADKDKRYLRGTFGLFLAPEVVDRLVDAGQPPELGGEIRELSAFFSDIADYTAISESMTPDELVDFLNDYLSVISEAIEEHGGFVDKYIGDAVVGVFGAPHEDPDHARHAVEAALAIQARLDDKQRDFAALGARAVATRIGIASGEMLVGNIGSRRRFNYTVVGDTVNLAARLEGANKVYGTRILVGDRTRDLAGDALLLREIDRIRVVGRASPVTVFEPVARRDAATDEQIGRTARFAASLEDYRGGRLAEATAGFSDLAADDPVARTYVKRIDALRSAPRPADWDGITDLVEK